MTHKRQRVREAVIATLTSIPDWSGRVFANRARPTEQAELPVALVYTVAEESELANIAFGLSRTLTLNLELRVSAVSSLDTVLDGYCEAAEAAMRPTQPLAGWCLSASFVAPPLASMAKAKPGRRSPPSITNFGTRPTQPAISPVA